MRTVTDMSVSGVKSLVSRAHLMCRTGSLWPSLWLVPKARVPRCRVAAQQWKRREPNGFQPTNSFSFIRATVPRPPHSIPVLHHLQLLRSPLRPEPLRHRPSSLKALSGEAPRQCTAAPGPFSLPSSRSVILVLLRDVLSLSICAAARRRRPLLGRTVGSTHQGASATHPRSALPKPLLFPSHCSSRVR